MNSMAACGPISSMSFLAIHVGNAWVRASASRSAAGLPNGKSMRRRTILCSTAFATRAAGPGLNDFTISTPWSTAA